MKTINVTVVYTYSRFSGNLKHVEAYWSGEDCVPTFINVVGEDATKIITESLAQHGKTVSWTLDTHTGKTCKVLTDRCTYTTF